MAPRSQYHSKGTSPSVSCVGSTITGSSVEGSSASPFSPQYVPSSPAVPSLHVHQKRKLIIRVVEDNAPKRVTTDAANFRAIVQELTGKQAPSADNVRSNEPFGKRADGSLHSDDQPEGLREYYQPSGVVSPLGESKRRRKIQRCQIEQYSECLTLESLPFDRKSNHTIEALDSCSSLTYDPRPGLRDICSFSDFLTKMQSPNYTVCQNGVTRDSTESATNREDYAREEAGQIDINQPAGNVVDHHLDVANLMSDESTMPYYSMSINQSSLSADQYIDMESSCAPSECNDSASSIQNDRPVYDYPDFWEIMESSDPILTPYLFNMQIEIA
ncbi:hypothetical protein KP509_09G088100 [Ceratopteris richardii]|uniref:VQ domain-containing protein n=1 Tax=Ceratopteris richardii TaxID=49495 RepID=A0A8T2U270_CERRI|nr:hypothetical protein KP509_09G088100 [Ceratopteris richardii]